MPVGLHLLGHLVQRQGAQQTEELAQQLPYAKRFVSLFGLECVECEGYEADDLVGTLSHAFPDTHSIIITGDRDAYQLVDDATDVYITKTGVSELLKLNIANFEKTLGFSPAQVVDIKALMGDTSDNIPGVAGIGEKTALTFFRVCLLLIKFRQRL